MSKIMYPLFSAANPEQAEYNTKLICDIMSTVACAIDENVVPSEHIAYLLKSQDVDIKEIIEHLRILVSLNQ